MARFGRTMGLPIEQLKQHLIDDRGRRRLRRRGVRRRRRLGSRARVRHPHSRRDGARDPCKATPREIRAKLVVEAANGPTTFEADEILRDRGIVVLAGSLRQRRRRGGQLFRVGQEPDPHSLRPDGAAPSRGEPPDPGALAGDHDGRHLPVGDGQLLPRRAQGRSTSSAPGSTTSCGRRTGRSERPGMEARRFPTCARRPTRSRSAAAPKPMAPSESSGEVPSDTPTPRPIRFTGSGPGPRGTTALADAVL